MGVPFGQMTAVLRHVFSNRLAGRTRYPLVLMLEPLFRCNLACAFCYAGCGTADARPGNADRERRRRARRCWPLTGWQPRPDSAATRRNREMTADEVLRVVDELARVGKVPSVSFTGGECTLRPELPTFIAHARQRGMRVNVITNGVRCADRAYVDQLQEAGLTSAWTLPGHRLKQRAVCTISHSGYVRYV